MTIVQRIEEFYGITKCGKIVDLRTMEECAYSIDKKRYKLYSRSLGFETKRSHRIIAFHCCERPTHLKQIEYIDLHVNHINGIKTDNRPENLEWCTPKENTQHAIKTGLDHRQDIRDGRHFKVVESRRNLRLPIKDLSEKYDMSPNSILRILKENAEYAPLNMSNDPKVDECIHLRESEQLTIDNIMEITGYKRTSIYLYIKQSKNYASMSNVSKGITEDEKLEILKLYKEEDLSAYAIAKVIERSKSTILRYLQTFEWYDGSTKTLKAKSANRYDFDKITELRESKHTWKQVIGILGYESINSVKSWYNKKI